MEATAQALGEVVVIGSLCGQDCAGMQNPLGLFIAGGGVVMADMWARVDVKRLPAHVIGVGDGDL